MQTPATPRVQIQRKPQRGSYDKASLFDVLDSTSICHVGYVVDGQPVVIPTLFWRDEERIYWHGSSLGRLELGPEGLEVCVTVTNIDQLVLARSAFHHSANYRSAVILGRAHLITDPEEKLRQLELFVESMFPGRWSQLRPITDKELHATHVLGLDFREFSVKARTGPVSDHKDDLDWPVWAGLIPVQKHLGQPMADVESAYPVPCIKRF